MRADIAVEQVGDPQAARPSSRVVGQVAQRAVLDLDEGVGVRQQDVAGRRQMHLSRASLEKLHPELALERLDALSQRWLRDLERRGRTAEMTRVGDM